MRFEPFDKKIKEAADHHHPAYDELAWRKMKKLLDVHMPEEEKKRRFLFLIPLFLLLGGGTWLALEYSGRKEAPTAQSEQRAGQISTNKQIPPSQDPEYLQTIDPVPGDGNQSPMLTRETGPPGITGVLVNNKTDKTHFLVPGEQVTETVTELPVPAGEGITVEERSETLNSSSNPVTPQEPLTSESQQAREKEKVVTADKQEKDPETSTPKKKRSPNRFFFFASLGADASFIREMGETRMMAGAGAGFTIRDKFIIRTGLFSARKIYSARSSAYDLPPNIVSYYPNLQRIDADCDVLEIPLLVSYQFGRSAKHKWMAGAGISSIFMKKEKYNYHFKPTPSSPVITREYTLKNESTHYFSIATLSAGYKRDLGKKVSITAEPYIKLPLAGVGLGKVKLNSGGIMVTVGISPFGK